MTRFDKFILIHLKTILAGLIAALLAVNALMLFKISNEMKRDSGPKIKVEGPAPKTEKQLQIEAQQKDLDALREKNASYRKKVDDVAIEQQNKQTEKQEADDLHQQRINNSSLQSDIEKQQSELDKLREAQK